MPAVRERNESKKHGMQSHATSVRAYLDSLPAQQQAVMSKIRDTILENLPEGFSEIMAYRMITYVVPHTRYPAGYHVDPRQPLPFLSLAARENYIAFYHMGLYADPDLLSWFTREYLRLVKKKPDMGKSCLRFKKEQEIPYTLMADLLGSMSPEAYIQLYESTVKRRS